MGENDNIVVPKKWAERGFWAALLTFIVGYFGLDVSGKIATQADNLQPQPPAIVSDLDSAFNAERAYTRAALTSHAEHIIAIEQQLKLQPLKPGAPPSVQPGKSGATEKKS